MVKVRYYHGEDEDLDKGGIYIIINLKNGKKYLGSAKIFRRRARYHFYMLERNKHTNKYLQRSFNKCGKDNFEFKIIEFCEINQCLDIEQKYLDEIFLLNNHSKLYYNIAHNATSPMFGLRLSKESRLKVSKAFKGKKHTVEAKEKNRLAHLGKKHSDFSKEKIKKSLTGKNNPGFISRIMAENIQTNDVFITESLKEMSKKIGCSPMSISRRLCTHSKKHTNSLIFGIWKVKRIE